MPAWIGPLLNGILGMTVLTLIVSLALPLLARRYRQRTVYGLLIVCLLGFLIPWRPLITPRPAVTVELPAETVRQLRPVVRPPVQEAEAILYDSEIARSANTVKNTVPAPRRPVNIFAIAVGIWLAGALGVLVLSGETTLEVAEAAPHRPDLILPSVKELGERLAEAHKQS